MIGRILSMRTTSMLSINEKSDVKHVHLEEDPSKLPTKVDPVSPDSDRPPSCLRYYLDRHLKAVAPPITTEIA
ncbi:unnamed protein product [Dibothriocephalus latus]|uniref:Uncharacterized protein n=1 Tax=Dibothriocephalus latus TaxID=60516 RepID=A0A3P7LW92_DIBLA|nr:unnamed protein product [Dibothriocephalus latus]